MIPRKRGADKGQALVEFALILIVVLLFIFIIIEAGRLFQSWLTLQNAARSAGRYAMTGQFETDCLFVFPPCLDPRVQSIKDEGRRSASGLNIDDNAVIGEPQSFVTELWSVDESSAWVPDFAGGSADPIRVRVTYYLPIITPLLRPIAETVRLRGQVVVVAEDFDQLGTSQAQSGAPPIGDAGDTGGGGPTGGLPDLDLELNKSASSLNVRADSPLDYVLDIVNHGPFVAENVTVVDTLPAGTTFITGTVTGGGFCDPPDPSLMVTCYLPNLAGDGSIFNSASVTIQTNSPDAPGTIINNTATVYNGTTALDTDLSNNTDTISVTVRPASADLAINIADSPPILVNTPLTYTLTVDNFGPDDATGIVVTATLPANHQGFEPGGVPGVCTPLSFTVLRCDGLADLMSGGQHQFQIIVKAPFSAGPITASAVVTGNEADPDLSNNNDSVVTTVADTLGDAFVQKSAPAGTLPVGVDFTYTIIAGNNGPDVINTLIVTDTLPASVSIVGYSSTCSIPGGGTVVCTAPGPVTPSSSETFTITVTPNVAETISNQVIVGGDILDPEPMANNFDVVDTNIGAGDLEISKSGASFVVAGQPLTYTLTITNNGPEAVTGVTIVDDLPPNLGSVTVSPSILCSVGGGQVMCGPGGPYTQMLSGASLTAIVTGTAPADSLIVNTATVDSIEPDLDESNNTAVLTSTTVLAADLEISKFAIPELSATEGSVNAPLLYFIQVVNKGPSAASGVVVTDTLPSGVLLGDMSPGCSNAGGLVTCVISDVIVGPTVNLTMNVTPTVPGVITNTAYVSGLEIDLVNINNTASVTTTILPADLAIEKFAPATVRVTDTFTYTIVVNNNGPASAVDVVITDTLPVSVTNPVANSSKGTCSSGSGLVICDVGKMVVSETMTVTISVTPFDIGLAVNEVVVGGGGTDPSQIGDDMDSTVTNIVPVADLAIDKSTTPGPFYAGEP